MKRWLYFALIGVILGCAGAVPIACAQLGSAAAPPPHPKPILRIGNRYYFATELFGKDSDQLRTEFEAYAAKLDDATLRGLAGASANPLKNGANATGVGGDTHPVLSRSELTDEAWQRTYHQLLIDVAIPLVRASVTDALVSRYGIDLDRYFDRAPLKDALARTANLYDAMYAHSSAAPITDDAFMQDMNKKLRLRTLDPAYWRIVFQIGRSDLLSMKWHTDAFRRSLDLHDYQVKSVLGHYILQQACERGSYFQRASDLWRIQGSSFEAVDIHGYRGDREALQHYLSTVIDGEGHTAEGGISALRQCLRIADPEVSLDEKIAPGDMLSLTAWPVFGKLYEVSPGSYRVYGLMHRADPGPLQTIRSQAYQLAIEPLVPPVECLVPGMRLWDPAVLGSVELGADAVIQVQVDPFIKKPFGDTVFSDLEKNKTNLDTDVVNALRARAATDPTAWPKAMKEVQDHAQQAETPEVKQRYQALLDKIGATTP